MIRAFWIIWYTRKAIMSSTKGQVDLTTIKSHAGISKPNGARIWRILVVDQFDERLTLLFTSKTLAKKCLKMINRIKP